MRGKCHRRGLVTASLFAILLLVIMAPSPVWAAWSPFNFVTPTTPPPPQQGPNLPPPPSPPPPSSPPEAPEPATLVTALLGSSLFGYFTWRRRQERE